MLNVFLWLQIAVCQMVSTLLGFETIEVIVFMRGYFFSLFYIFFIFVVYRYFKPLHPWVVPTYIQFISISFGVWECNFCGICALYPPNCCIQFTSCWIVAFLIHQQYFIRKQLVSDLYFLKDVFESFFEAFTEVAKWNKKVNC